jgi:fermentation-respiration switch protein FrsA (DUF1100 family)
VFQAWQDGLIFPGHVTRGRPEARVVPPPDSELVRLETARGTPITALLARALDPSGQPDRDPDRRPTILFFYGNGMCLAACLDLVAWFRSLGAHVLVPDYVGYGLSSGQPSETGCHDTARACFRHLQSRPGAIDPTRVIAAGWSLGGAVAIPLAAAEPVAALAAFSTFTTLADVVTSHMPWIPAEALLRHRFDSLAAIARVTCPILLGHGRRDSIIPASMMPRLAHAAAANARVTSLLVENADHNDFFESARDQLTPALQSLIEEVAAPR